METFSQYFSYNSDYNTMMNAFEMLYKKMQIIHNNGLQVPYIDADHIYVDNDSFSFENMVLSENINVGSRENLVDLTKLFIGSFLSLSTGFRDFSHVPTEWFSSNLDDINSSISADDYPSDFFSRVLFNGENLYYNDYLVEKEKMQSSVSNKNVHKKVLSNASSVLYSDMSNIDDDDSFKIVEKKSAFINVIFYPVMLGSILLICFVLYSLFILLNR